MTSILRAKAVAVMIGMTAVSYLFHKWSTPHERGFHCSDHTIAKPFYPVIIPMFTVLCMALTTLFLTVVTTEYLFGFHLKQVIDELTKFYVGLMSSILLTHICKTYFGRLRPNSIDGICNARHYCADDPTRYVDQFVCINASPRMAREARMSFYSGHSALAMYVAFYAVLYLLYRFKSNTNPKTKCIVYAIQCIIFILGMIPGFTQGYIYWHHWSDIGTGYSVGALIAYLAINYA
ncbi:unnamed protein product [Medioppia subpectinata]|uniref:Phosphatidic acid phosphatase type 2/haloperoxidase domain-containing protein n=1 Tax=Medioppia subpectinata TaxID=1979941 RepID=A0A7R9KYE0_9ACAR|nr:unnamed protein product [Medioppia subpectinata]CAG2112158.1 unnamed protein product [Medioppia subpectinata]